MFFRPPVNMRKTNSGNVRFFILIVLMSVVLTGCIDFVNTKGTLEIKGKVSDEDTRKGIPFKNIIIQGLVISKNNNKSVPVEAGRFATDSSGSFRYSLRKIKGVKHYNFCFTGDSDYIFTTSELNLYDLKINSRLLFFSLKRLADLTVQINRKTKSPVCDTLSLAWESDGVYFWFLCPYSVSNFGTNKSFEPASDMGLTWVGGNISTTVSTKVFANRKTKLSWELYRDGKRQVFTDTITCKRDIINVVYFTY